MKTIPDMVSEWRRGCSCAGRAPEEGRHPAECVECTTALIDAVDAIAKERIASTAGDPVVSVHGVCKLDSPDSMPGTLRDCHRHLEPIDFLRRVITRYIDNPGCNINTRRTAMERLRWALLESER